MNVDEVRQRLQAIAAAAPDDEAQHGLEDQLFVDVLEEIMKTSSGQRSRDLARTALGSRKIDFERWCA